ncbi:MAG: DUF58 domain-containing protein [Firmicutes bacterium]|nr:DUF58 domain-containing protein [Bacillota bacterium]
MVILWFLLGAAALCLLQRSLFQRLWFRRLSVQVRFDVKSVAAGEPVTLTERLENRKPMSLPVVSYEYGLNRNFRPYSQKGNGAPLAVRYRLALPANRAVTGKAELPGLPRGIYSLSTVTLQAQDLFSRQPCVRTFPSPSTLTVCPKKLPAAQIQLPFRLILGSILTRRYSLEDPFEIRSVRPYESYDSMRSINWNASAKTGAWKVNQHDYTTDEALCLVLDLENGTPEQREAAICLASSLCQLFLSRGVAVNLRTNARSCINGRPIELPLGSGISHLSVIDENLAQITVGAAVKPFAAYLDGLANAKGGRQRYTAVSASNDPQVLRAFDALCADGGGYYLYVQGTAPAPAGSRRFTVLPWQPEDNLNTREAV